MSLSTNLRHINQVPGLNRQMGNWLSGRNPNAQQQAHTAAVSSDREWAERQAQAQKDFQREMSDTQWQRGVKDMQKAGLNPALAFMQGGASAPMGASADSGSSDQTAQMHLEMMQWRFANSAMRLLGQLT